MGKIVAYVGLDDTDNEESRGTGHLARRLARHLGGRSLGVTRHQFLVHPDIPFTSHNSGACVAVEIDEAGLAALTESAKSFVESESAPGSDPGVCVAVGERLGGEILSFAQDARKIIVKKERALALAQAAGVSLTEHGGDGLGVIGALSSAALRASGLEGRFLDLNGIRDIGDIISVGELLDKVVDRVVDPDGNEPPRESRVITHKWVRPELEDNCVVLKVIPLAEGGEAEYEVDRSDRKKSFK